jgi:hypothetical protein
MITRASVGIIILAGSLIAAGCNKIPAADTTILETNQQTKETGAGSNSAAEAQSGTVQVSIENYAFGPTTLKGNHSGLD